MDGVHLQVCICRRDLLGKLLENQFRNILPLDLDGFSKLQNCEVGNGDLLSPDEEGFLTDVAIQLQRLLSSISTQSYPLFAKYESCRSDISHWARYFDFQVECVKLAVYFKPDLGCRCFLRGLICTLSNTKLFLGIILPIGPAKRLR